MAWSRQPASAPPTQPDVRGRPTRRRANAGRRWGAPIAAVAAAIVVGALLVVLFRDAGDSRRSDGVSQPTAIDQAGAEAPPAVDQIAFSALIDDGTSARLLIAHADESGIETLVGPDDATLTHAPGWSPDGQRLVYLKSDANSAIVVLDFATRESRELLAIGHTDGEFLFPHWSPADDQIAYVGVSGDSLDLFVVDADGSEPRNLTNDAAIDGPAMEWSPNGTRIVYQTMRDGNSDIYVVNADGSNKRNVSGLDGDEFVPTWSPDGEQIAFYTRPSGNGEIYVVNADGTGRRNLTRSPGDDLYPVWSPDGSTIAYTYVAPGDRPSGAARLYLMDSDGADQRAVASVDGYGAIHPAWSSDSKQIAFTLQPLEQRDSPRRSLWVVNADGTDPRRLSEHAAESAWPAWRPRSASPERTDTATPVIIEATATPAAGEPIPLPPGVGASGNSSATGIRLVGAGAAPLITREEAMRTVADFGAPWALGGEWDGKPITIDAWYGLATITGEDIRDRPMWILDYGNVRGIIPSIAPNTTPPPPNNHNVYAVDAESLRALFVGSFHRSEDGCEDARNDSEYLGQGLGVPHRRQ